MLGKALLPAAILFLALLPTSHAAASDIAPVAAPVGACATGLPPCGYIVPQLSLEFPDKPPCKAASLGGAVDLTKCLQLPAKGQSVVQKGVLRWYWDITQDGDYPIDPMTPIVIQFSGTATNPKWMDLKVDPQQFTLDATAMADPTNLKPDTNAQKVWFWYEKPITVTITRTGDPDAVGLQKIGNANGVQKVFLKAKSNSSGAYFKEAFGVEEFRFNAYADPAIKSAAMSASGASSGHSSPAVGPMAMLGVLAFALVARRRR
jgi:MYXO-CTERM domain-containing protein